MKYKILIQNPKIWGKDFKKIPEKFHKEIQNKILKLENQNFENNPNIKKLKKYPTSDFRLRIGNYRVLFDSFKKEKIIKLYRILHRSKLY